MIRRDIVILFYKLLYRDADGRYFIESNGDRHPVEVEDTPFIVKKVDKIDQCENGGQKILITLSDETVESLDPETLTIGNDNVMYCTVKNKRFAASFSRAGYYQLAEYIEYCIEKEKFIISLNDKHFIIKSSY
jgi:hypothetical protein